MKFILILGLVLSSSFCRADFCGDLLKKTYTDTLENGIALGQVAGMISYISQIPQLLESAGFSSRDIQAFERGMSSQLPLLEKELEKLKQAQDYKMSQFGNDLDFYGKNCL